MKVSIRESKFNSGLSHLQVYRPRERAWSLSGSAYQTQSGYWILNIPGQPSDVVKGKADAAFALQNYYAAKETAYE